jgi:hypothetical protein
MESASRWGLDLLARFDLPPNHDARPALLRALTELYIQKPTHTADEERHYTELALRLLDTADIATRAAVAQRLAEYGSPPRRVIERLGGNVSSGHGQGQPFRSAASFMRDDGRTHRAPIDLDVASTLNELFFAANPDERRLILLNLDVIAPFPARRMKLSREDSLSGRLEAAVLSRNREAFAQHLAQALHISRAQARRVADDDLGEPIVAAAKTLDIRRGALYRILLFVNIGRSVARVQALTELHHELPRQTAEHMVAIWQSLPNVDRPAERHQPVLWEDNPSSRPRIASATRQQALLAPPKQRDAR